MARQEQKQPWWERPAKTPGEPYYEPQREQLRAELARARRADVSMRAFAPNTPWRGSGTPRAA